MIFGTKPNMQQKCSVNKLRYASSTSDSNNLSLPHNEILFPVWLNFGARFFLLLATDNLFWNFEIFLKLKKLPKLELDWKLCQTDRNLHYNKPNPINELTVLASNTDPVWLIFMTQQLFLSHRPVTCDEIEFAFDLPQEQTLTWNVLELKKKLE